MRSYLCLLGCNVSVMWGDGQDWPKLVEKSVDPMSRRKIQTILDTIFSRLSTGPPWPQISFLDDDTPAGGPPDPNSSPCPKPGPAPAGDSGAEDPTGGDPQEVKPPCDPGDAPATAPPEDPAPRGSTGHCPIMRSKMVFCLELEPLHTLSVDLNKTLRYRLSDLSSNPNIEDLNAAVKTIEIMRGLLSTINSRYEMLYKMLDQERDLLKAKGTDNAAK